MGELDTRKPKSMSIIMLPKIGDIVRYWALPTVKESQAKQAWHTGKVVKNYRNKKSYIDVEVQLFLNGSIALYGSRAVELEHEVAEHLASAWPGKARKDVIPENKKPTIPTKIVQVDRELLFGVLRNEKSSTLLEDEKRSTAVGKMINKHLKL